jgi:hypothetical protein
MLIAPLFVALFEQTGVFGVPVTRTLTYTTTATTTMTDVETSTLYWTLSEESTIPITKTTTYTTTGTLVIPVWKLTTTTGKATSTKTWWTTTTKITTKTTSGTITFHILTVTFKLPYTTTYTTLVTVWTLRTSTTTSTYTKTTSYIGVISVPVAGVVTTMYPTETVTTLVSTSASTVMMAEINTQTFTQTLTIPYVTEEAAPPSKQCIIATVAHESEYAPEVQLLRTFRDSIVMSTNSGRSFMTLFNRWYYSFSPSVAKMISENQLAKGIVKISLYPLITALRVSTELHSALGSNGELATTMTGVVAASILGLVYAFPAIVVLSVARRKRR